MRRPEFIARQAAHPRGLVGRLLFRVMAAETLAVNERALQLLELEPNSRVLEIGFGHGRTLARALELAPNGLVAGIDVSADMVGAFRSRQRRSNGQVPIEVKQASSDRIPYPDAHFDRVYAVHTVYFWNSPLVHLREIRRVMNGDSRFILAFTPKEDPHAIASFPTTVYRFYSIEETRRFLSEAGFRNVSMAQEPIGSRDTVFSVCHC
jgi:ubiquinone/menaquinone biosynthesis C-methylase UbiE